MAIPKQDEIEIPLLTELNKLGGSARPADLYDRLIPYFSSLTSDDLARLTQSKPQIRVWNNRIQWARQKLVEKGEIDRSERGVWKITEAGIARIHASLLVTAGIQTSPPTLRDLLGRHEEEIRQELAENVSKMEPGEFEHFSRKLLNALGFEDVIVTQLSHDGGIDGYGLLRMGVVRVSAAFQCKRWQGNVPRPEIDRFRGAVSGRFDQGIFITTSSFTKDAADASIRPGAVPIVMIDGEQIVELMLQHGIGVRTRPVTIVEIDREFFASPHSD